LQAVSHTETGSTLTPTHAQKSAPTHIDTRTAYRYRHGGRRSPHPGKGATPVCAPLVRLHFKIDIPLLCAREPKAKKQDRHCLRLCWAKRCEQACCEPAMNTFFACGISSSHPQVPSWLWFNLAWPHALLQLCSPQCPCWPPFHSICNTVPCPSCTLFRGAFKGQQESTPSRPCSSTRRTRSSSSCPLVSTPAYSGQPPPCWCCSFTCHHNLAHSVCNECRSIEQKQLARQAVT
jgi:hypothetical protein